MTRFGVLKNQGVVKNQDCRFIASRFGSSTRSDRWVVARQRDPRGLTSPSLVSLFLLCFDYLLLTKQVRDQSTQVAFV